MRDLWNRPALKALVVVGAIVAGAAAWWLGSPLVLDNAVDEAFPMAALAVVPDDMTIEEVEAEMVAAAETRVVMPDEEMPGGGEPAGASETTMAVAPAAILSGQFRGADEFHQGSGTATIYQLEDGSSVLRFEDFDVTNGPDLHVLLVPHPDPSARDDITGYIDLGSLKGNIGNQNYPIPADIEDVAAFGSVVIYCEPFHVLFASASLQQ